MREDLCRLIFRRDFYKARELITDTNLDLNFINTLERSPLLLATGADNLEFVEYLLIRGADPNYIDVYILPISNAIENVAFKLDYSKEDSLDKRMVKLLYDYGAKVDIKDKSGETALDFLYRYFGYDNIDDFLQKK
ncbi:ankyrin repeat domain-containing protein [Chryseobacterium joostei]|uniref:Ankyrin repeat domain-containing protein n=1 Tax=Chryseobacterium joostei TaxID=112234 RepID=A0A1N7IMF1_9FLAO|nr:ankyrin repeat domain-containing protein [Chryseobacterium joostei]AZA98495.1 ankyrin repeat domain-containing protein [Chryseobacterium joostei]SIS38232.1 hypothetical protein SAMN05421768_10678 [Chryseobacterium joostei]